MKSRLYTPFLFFIFILLTVLACNNEYNIDDTTKENSQKDFSMRMMVPKGSSFFNVNIYAYKIQNADTLFFKSFEFDGYALLNPMKLTLEMGDYFLVGVGNVDGSATQPSIGESISDLLYTLMPHQSTNGTYNPLHELYYGSTTTTIGGVHSDTIKLKHLVAKVRIAYQHSDSFLSQISWKLSDLYYGVKMNGSYVLNAGNGVKVQQTYLPPSVVPNIYKDSIYVFPSAGQTVFTLNHTRMINSIETEREYSSNIHPILPNYVTDINVFGGQDASFEITQTPILLDDKYYILDEAPSSAVNIIIDGFRPSAEDTVNLQSIDLSINVNQGVLSNYLTNFKFTITKNGPLPLPNPSSITKTVALKIVDGKLKTVDPIRLSRGTYTLSSYSLYDVDGYLLDPAGKAEAKDFVVELGNQIINLQMDGRQGVDNMLLRNAVTELHGTTQIAGSVYPGSVLFALDPLGSTFPSLSDGLTKTKWFVDNNAYVEKIPIRGEWRVYNFVYRGNGKTPLKGKLSQPLTQLSKLSLIDFGGNNITGLLESYWSSMENITTLILNNNLLSGNIDNLGPLTKIKRLSLENNNFTGGITTGLAGCTSNLIYLSLNNNKFNGDVSIISLDIENLFIQNNKFTGSIPPFIINNASAQWDSRYNYFTCKSSQISSNSRVNPQYIPNTTTTTNIDVCP